MQKSILFRRQSHIILICIFGFVLSAAVPMNSNSRPLEKEQACEVGLASYYARKFHGRRTASGERYDMHAMTAAHRALKFGSLVEVTNLKNGRKVEVRINDRGPFIKGRVIDLSYAAAKKIGILSQGVVKVRVSPVP
jgi:rare lipoprotein A